MTSGHTANCKALFAFLLVVTCLSISIDAAEKKYTKQEINDLLTRVWQASELDLNNFRDYVFCEREVRGYELLDGTTCEALRLASIPVCQDSYAGEHEYVWVVRDGHFVRSLTHVDGVEVSTQQQKVSEEQWIKEEQKRTKAKSAFEYFFLSDRAIGNPFALKQMKEGNYKYKGEIILEKRSFIMLRADYSSPLVIGYTFFIAPELNRLVQFDVNLGSNGKYSMLMAQPVDKTWLPVKCSGSFEWSFRGLSSSQYGFIPPYHYKSWYSRKFYSFKKSDVKAKFWFEGVDAEVGNDTDKSPQSKH